MYINRTPLSIWSKFLVTVQVIRHYHGHLSGVYSLALHPTLDLLMTGGRDSVCRVWDMRSKVQAHVLTGHDDTVCSILSQPTDPQVSSQLGGARLACLTISLLLDAKTVSLTSHGDTVCSILSQPTDPQVK